MPRSKLLAAALLAVSALLAPAPAVPPVEFVFHLPPQPGSPFARDVWAEVTTPSAQSLRLPAFYVGEDRFAVRARASEPGRYRLGAVTELADGRTVPLAARPEEGGVREVTAVTNLPPVGVATGPRPGFVLPDGTAWQPIGANLAWATDGRPVPFYRGALGRFRHEGLNWIRIWMAHWGALNLDWPHRDSGPAPEPGQLDLRVAAAWDEIIAAAEDAGVRVQLVLQHHGQYSTRVNPNWSENPWNASRPGGFLETPGAFFTSPRARELTAAKYRYIAARWGYSPAILAWELFNEVHWVDALRIDRQESAVAAWHAEMAGRLRAADAYRHPVTTSTEDLRSPVYRDLDYYQPHLYPVNILASVRRFHPAPAELDRPVFYGEVGDDHQALDPEAKASGVAIVPPVWASLMGHGRQAAQPWLGWDLLAQERLGELGAVARFAAATGLGQRDDLVDFAAAVECATRLPLILTPGQVWQRRAGPDLHLPLDGREPPEVADLPRNLVFKPESIAEGFPQRVTFRLDAPRDLRLRVGVATVGRGGGALRLVIDGQPAAARTWVPGAGLPTELTCTIPAGPRTLVVENHAGPDWVQLGSLDFGLDQPILAAIGRRSDRFVAAWLWHRQGVMDHRPVPPVPGTLVLDAVPAGTWRVTWWNTLAGVPLRSETLAHPGGDLRLPTPAISRHAAVVLENQPAPPAPELARLLAPSNLLAWCIVPFDSRKRGPAERVAMLQRLGFGQYVWDWRPEHLPHLAEEIRLARAAGLRLRGVWLWIDANADRVGELGAANRELLAILARERLAAELWVGFHPNFFADLDDAGRVAKGAAMISQLRDLAAPLGCTVALYNHGDWFGEPENELKILGAVGDPSVGLVYNFHHGHDQIDRYRHFLPRLVPHLRAVNLNGMRPEGPKILPLGTGTHEREMLRVLQQAGYRGPIGLLGHVDDADVEEVLARNLAGARELARGP